ncbi:transcriptional regulator [Paenibacillus flagellatus]|uniref:Transcriptional regulator n=1 Tax=Paenibacillus flagellatus TaxID=2211139 RepID=A0A2V5KEU5_9BACL|nr:transcriptional regulator [Paenibacillus flagellatus]
MIGDTITRLRKQRRWSQQVVADRLKIAKSTYAGYESGYREPSLDTMRLLAELFEVSLDELVGQQPEPESASPDLPPPAPELDDPELGLWFKELLEAPEERRDELRKIWEIIKTREADRTPGAKQGEE